jgi:opacity protein-like surface antigen
VLDRGSAVPFETRVVDPTMPRRRTRCSTRQALLAGALVCASLAAAAHARADEIGIWGGGSVASSTLIGKSTGFDLELAGLQYAHRLWGNDALSFGFTIDAIPLALISLDRGSGRHTIYGAGLAPLGFRLAYEGFEHLRPYAAASGGFLYFSDRIPADGEKFNFTYDFGAGIQIEPATHWLVALGYRYHHISNAGLADSNPGFDSNVLYAGFSWSP